MHAYDVVAAAGSAPVASPRRKGDEVDAVRFVVIVIVAVRHVSKAGTRPDTGIVIVTIADCRRILRVFGLLAAADSATRVLLRRRGIGQERGQRRG